jgi:hypothetical protein
MPETVGNEILAMKKACEKQVPYERTDCPVCGWNLEKKEGVLHCKFCGLVIE